jgi:MOSC domain-containing protein YiiM
MTTFDPDTAEQDTEVLLRIHRELGGALALDCEVVQPGEVNVGDPVTLVSGPSTS